MNKILKITIPIIVTVLFTGCGKSLIPSTTDDDFSKEPTTSVTNEQFEYKAANLIKEGKTDEFITYSKEYCKYGQPAACYNVGTMYFRGFANIQKDFEVAKRHFKYSCKKDYARSCHSLGVIYKIEGDREKAIENFKKASDLGSSYGDFSLGLIYSKTDKNLAKFHYKKGCDLNLAQSCTNLAGLLRQENLKDQALLYDMKGCDLKDSKACFNAGVTNYLDKKYEDSLKNFIKGCELGNYQSCERAQDLVKKDPILSKSEKDELLKVLEKTIEDNKTRRLNDEA